MTKKDTDSSLSESENESLELTENKLVSFNSENDQKEAINFEETNPYLQILVIYFTQELALFNCKNFLGEDYK